MRSEPKTSNPSKTRQSKARPAKVVAKLVGGFPVPTISEESGIVTLHFESDYVQSQMVAEDPDFLALSYTRAMMSFEMLKTDAAHILIIGLGGGSLAKWCYRHHPNARLTVAEINPHVIALRDRFHIPPDDHRFEILCEDGAVSIAKQDGCLDVILVDVFGVDSVPEDLCSQSFYDACYRALSRQGLMVVNLCTEDAQPLVTRIRQSFDARVLCSAGHDGNTVAIACKEAQPWPEGATEVFLKQKQAEFEKKHRMGKPIKPVG